jgi:transposase
MTATLASNDTTNAAMLYMALELSASKWRLAFGADGTERVRQVVVDAGDLAGLSQAIERAKAKLGLAPEAAVSSVYEAGRDGFWLHRWLLAQGIDNRVIDAASVELRQGKKRRKTDRLDAALLLRKLRAWLSGDRRVFSVVRVPPEAVEGLRRLERERERLRKERDGHGSRIRSLLATEGHLRVSLARGFPERLRQLRRWDGAPLAPALVAELEREWARLEQVRSQLSTVEAEQRRAVQEADTAPLVLVRALMRLKGIGWTSAWILVFECLGWRSFANRREVAGFAGLTPTPFDSGASRREQGIDKNGNRRVRTLLVELAWRWLRWQPDSALSRWFQQRYGSGSKRQRRIGIVALARRLLIQLWRYAAHGEVPGDVVLKAV